MKRPSILLRWLVCAIAVAAPMVSPAATYTKADNTNSLDVAASWGGTAPGSTDIARWSGAYSGGPATGAVTNSLYAIFAASSTPTWGGINIGAVTGSCLTQSPIFNGTTTVSNITAATEAVVNGFNVVTITCNANHRFENGQSVMISGVTPAGYNGTFIIAGVPSATQFTYTNATGSLAAAAAAGLVTANAAANMYVGGSGTGNGALTIGTSGITVASGAPGVVINDASTAFNGAQTWNLAAGTLVRFAVGGGAATGKAVTSGADGLIELTGGGIVSLNEGGASGFSDAAGFTGFTGNWQVDSGTTLRGLRNGATAFGAGSITLNGGTLAVGGMSGDVGNWTWNTPITLNSGTTSYLADQNVSGTARSLLLSGAISGSGNIVFTEPLVGATSFTSQDLGFILSGSDSMAGTVTIGGPVENGVPGRLSYVRVGGNATGTATTVGAGANGSLGSATAVIDNGVLTFTLTGGYALPCAISGTGALRIGSLNSATGTGGYVGDAYQNITLTGANTYSGPTVINAGTLTLSAGSSLANSSGITIVTNSVNGGAAVNTFDVSALTGGFTTAAGQTLSLNGGQLNGNFNFAAGSTNILAPGGSNTIGALTISGNLTLSGGSNTLVLDINNSASDSIAIGGNLTASGVTTLQFVPPGTGLNAGTYPLITAAGTVTATPANFRIAGLAAGARPQTFSLAVSGNAINLVVVGSPGNLTWVGDNTANVWSTSTTFSNWYNQVTAVKDIFVQNDVVTFDDSGSASPNIALTGVLYPGTVTVSASAKNYTFGGTGQIAGPTGLTVSGTGQLTLNTSNSFTGQVLINGGGILAITNEAALGGPTNLTAQSLVLDNGSALLITNSMKLSANTNRGIIIGTGGGTFTVTNGATLTISNTIGDLSGTSVLTQNGNGTLILDGNNNYGGGTIINGGTVVCGSSHGFGLSGSWCPGVTIQAGVADINGQGNYSNTNLGLNPNMLFNSVFLTFNGNAGATMVLTDSVPGHAGFCLYGTASVNAVINYNGANNPGKATIAAGWYAVGTGAYPRTYQVKVDPSTATPVGVEFTAPLSYLGYEGKFATVQKTGAGTLEISAPNYFPGLQVSAGTLLVNNANALGADRSPSYAGQGGGMTNLVTVDGGTIDLNGFSPAIEGLTDNGAGTGTILNNGPVASTLTLGYSPSNSVAVTTYGSFIADGTHPVALVLNGLGMQTLTGVNTYSGTTTVSNGTLVVNSPGQIGLGAATNQVTVTGGALGGSGTVNAPVTVRAGGTLAPGAGATTTATLTINGNLTLAGTNVMNVNKDTATNDAVVLTSGAVNYGGTLVISTNLMTATTLALGDSFQLFSVPAHSGNFTSVIGTPGTGLGWSFNPANGTVTVVTGLASNPTNITVSVTGGTMTLSWPADHLGWLLQSQTNTLSTGLGTNWVDMSGSAAVTSMSLPIVPANPTVFYRLRHP